MELSITVCTLLGVLGLTFRAISLSWMGPLLPKLVKAEMKGVPQGQGSIESMFSPPSCASRDIFVVCQEKSKTLLCRHQAFGDLLSLTNSVMQIFYKAWVLARGNLLSL